MGHASPGVWVTSSEMLLGMRVRCGWRYLSMCTNPLFALCVKRRGRFVEARGTGRVLLEDTPGNSSAAVDTVINSVMRGFHTRRAPRHGRVSNYWYTMEIAELREVCHKLRRLKQFLIDQEEA